LVKVTGSAANPWRGGETRPRQTHHLGDLGLAQRAGVDAPLVQLAVEVLGHFTLAVHVGAQHEGRRGDVHVIEFHRLAGVQRAVYVQPHLTPLSVEDGCHVMPASGPQ
jgi:hypothetical protein